MKLRSQRKGLARIRALHLWGARGSSLLFLLLAVGLFAFSTSNPGQLQGLRTHATDIVSPLLAVVNRPIEEAAGYVRTVSGLSQLQAENARLRAENARLREWYQSALTLKEENQALQEMLNIQLDPSHRFITTRVLADSRNAFAKSILVDAGTRENVEKGQAVLAGEGLVGRIIESGRRSARVLLLTDINSRIPVLLLGTNQRAVMAGTNEQYPGLLHLPPDLSLEPGLRVITSGHGGLFPYGLPVGEIVKTSKGTFAVRPYAELESLHFVRVIEKDGHSEARLQSDEDVN